MIRDSIYVMEVKSKAELDHVEYLMEKKLVKRILGRNFDKAMSLKDSRGPTRRRTIGF